MTAPFVTVNDVFKCIYYRFIEDKPQAKLCLGKGDDT